MIGAVSVSHLLNDLIQSTLPAIYPMLKSQFALSFGQVGMITAMFQLTASLLQPWVGLYTDRHPKPYLLPIGTIATLVGLLALSIAPSFPMLLAAAALIGIGSSTFHPEASRVARLASGGRYGLAQSLFQVGGNAGSALGPALAAAIIMPRGQGSIAWFAVFAVIAIAILTRVSRWYQNHLQALQAKKARSAGHGLTRRQVAAALIVLGVLVFSKYFYMASLTSYYTFYLISRFGLSVQSAQLHLFLFLAAVAVGTLVGGPIGDRIGRKYVIWVSILGVAPFTLALPYANLFWTGVLSVVIGLVLASAFSAIVVFAQELVPGRVGMVAGVFFGLMFGISGIGAALLGHLADTTSIAFVYKVCSFLPLIGVLTVLLPNMEKLSKGR
nr:MFS transporter [Chitinasiproducens palmae]